MDYRTILVHADPSSHAPARIRLAAALANRLGAHLAGVAATGISRFVAPEAYAGGPGDMLAGELDPLYDTSRHSLDLFESLACAAGVASFSRQLVGDVAGEALARQAAFADLVVLSQVDPDESTSDVASNLPEYVVLNCARPVLVVPHSRAFDDTGRRVLAAWNGSRQSIAALAGALPLLRGAEQVWIAMLDADPLDAPPGVDPAADLIAWLARHGVTAQLMPGHAEPDASAALLPLVEALQCDLLVMGCYGHAPLRELLLGGATRTVLQSMTVPVLMAH